MSDLIRILYVDDSQLDRGLVLDSLEKEHSGFKVIQAASRVEFEASLDQGGFDLFLSDFNTLRVTEKTLELARRMGCLKTNLCYSARVVAA